MHVMLLQLGLESSGSLVIRAVGPRFLIGRAEECQLRLTSPVASRRHCELLIDESGVFVQDLNSRHGTFLNGRPVKEKQALANGDTLHVASSAFEVSFPDHFPGYMTFNLPTRADVSLYGFD